MSEESVLAARSQFKSPRTRISLSLQTLSNRFSRFVLKFMMLAFGGRYSDEISILCLFRSVISHQVVSISLGHISALERAMKLDLDHYHYHYHIAVPPPLRSSFRSFLTRLYPSIASSASRQEQFNHVSCKQSTSSGFSCSRLRTFR